MDPWARLASANSWFLWIMGCTLVNCFARVTDTQFGLALGLCLPDIVAGICMATEKTLSTTGIILVIGSAALSCGVCFGLMKAGQHAKSWAFIVAILLYGCDALVYLAVQDWLSVGVHVWALVALSGGIGACAAIKKMPTAAATASASAAPETASDSTSDSASGSASNTGPDTVVDAT